MSRHSNRAGEPGTKNREPPDGPNRPSLPIFRAARARSGEGILRLVGALVLVLAGVPVVLIFALVASEGQRSAEPRCTVASCDAGADRDLPLAPPPTSQN